MLSDLKRENGARIGYREQIKIWKSSYLVIIIVATKPKPQTTIPETNAINNTPKPNMKNITTLCAVHRAIKLKTKGTTTEIAKSIDLSRSCFYEYITEITQHGGEVSYSRTSKCFYYQVPFDLKLEIEEDGMVKIFGGRNSFPSIANGRKAIIFDPSIKDNHL